VPIGDCDQSHLQSIRRFADRFNAQVPRRDVLVNNAGVLTQERGLSPDGIELTLATNVIGFFLLTNLLIPLIERSAPAPIINDPADRASAAHGSSTSFRRDVHAADQDR
jgi:NAD(P)-dependent dehydrogenase (short-subunit alcohol dehydrogenase family)